MNWFDNNLNYLREQKRHLFQESSNYLRFYLNVISPSTEVINEKEIRLVGLRRTGNHAIIVWIRAQHPEYTRHLNHPPAGENPYQFLYTHFKKSKLREAARGNFSKNSLLLISYEDEKIEKVCSAKFEKIP